MQVSPTLLQVARQVNEDLSYPHHLHHADHTQVTGVRLKGDMMVTFAGIVGKGDSTELNDRFVFADKLPGSLFPVHYNLTYACAEGQVS